MSEGLTRNIAYAMPFVELAGIVNNGNYSQADRLKAANAMHARAKGEMKGAGWLSLSRHEKELVREALKFDTTGEGFQPIVG
jgi:hypothetical protein